MNNSSTLLDDVDNHIYENRKKPHDHFVKGISAKNGKTVRARINGGFFYNYANHWDKSICKQRCDVCNVDCCDHSVMNAKQFYFKYTTDSRFQYKNVRKCTNCTTHICEDCIPIRGRKIKIDMDDI